MNAKSNLKGIGSTCSFKYIEGQCKWCLEKGSYFCENSVYNVAMAMMKTGWAKKGCPCCGSPAEMQEDPSIFVGQDYSDRYPDDVARQDHGYRVKCTSCGVQTCWWHYENEAVFVWNQRIPKQEGG